ncbi:polyhydroxyalkanoic acid system family protein [Sphingorhabdus sp. Alg239-R122]|uniref:polyhydroxyalkanoic acid system family protein n=1 Tax=Sphingorhabdus sp. Alg239-R122 TaxID=2305989 RepID=UPI0013DCDD0B|nr:polyhydroxyalkanoic acid system family protein [Sphingorhabdus sp. Alg239-R122]
MSEPVAMTILHKLGRAEAKKRIAGGIYKLEEALPGAKMAEHHWDEDALDFTLEAMGQRVSCNLDIKDDAVDAVFHLPPLLAMFADKFREKMQKEAPKLLE